MSFVLGGFIGLLVGSVVYYFVYKNNKTKMDAITKRIEEELGESETLAKIKNILK